MPNRPGGPPARAEVLACVSPGQPLATVKVTSTFNAERTFEVRVTFESATTADVLDRTSLHITLQANESRSVHVKMVDPGKAEQVKNCMVSVSLV
ncbi:hypothetical protein [Streptomyces sp. NPDC051567]|uniref:hypothetical protein n=1 Tax=Streptomyces sp. NPDC051567 TaxID=3365660 RepID=UPI0037879BA8